MIEVNESFYFAFLAVCPRHFSFSETSTDVLLSLLLGFVSNNRRNANVFSRFYLLFSIRKTQCLTYNPIGYEVECFHARLTTVIGLIAGIVNTRASRIDIPFAKAISPPNLSFCRMKTGSALASVELLSNRNI